MNSASSNRTRTIGLLIGGTVLGIGSTVAVLLGISSLTNDSPKNEIVKATSQVEANESLNGVERSRVTSTKDRDRELGLLKFLSRAPSAFEREEALYSLLFSADVEMLSNLLEQSNYIGSEHLQHLTQTTIVQRFATVDPKKALSAISTMPTERRNPLTSTVFGEWSLINLDEAIAHAKTLEASKQYAALQGILDSQEDLSMDVKEDIATQLDIDLNVLEQQAFTESISQEWEALIADERSKLAQTADLIRLAHKWVDQSGLAAIAQIDQSLQDGILKKAVIGSVLQRALLTDPQETLQQAMVFEDDLQELVLETIARAWASIGPQEAMESIASIETPRVRRQMLEHFVTAWANFAPKDMFDKFDLIPENLQLLAQEQAIRTLAKTTPEEAFQFLEEISDDYLKFELTMEIATKWSEKNAMEALNWVLSEEFSSAAFERQILHTVLRNLATENPELALQTALDQPVDVIGLGLEATVIDAVARIDIERALSMLAQVREGYTKSFTAVGVGKALVRNNETDRALDLAQQLPEEDRDSYYNLIVNEWAYSDPKSLAGMLDKLPTSEAKYHAAMDLNRLNVGTNVLTKEQMSFVRDHLPKDYNWETGRRGSESQQFARLNNIQNKDLTEEERAQIQRDFRKMMMEGRYRVYRLPSQE